MTELTREIGERCSSLEKHSAAKEIPLDYCKNTLRWSACEADEKDRALLSGNREQRWGREDAYLLFKGINGILKGFCKNLH